MVACHVRRRARKPSSLALGAYSAEGELVGYAFVSRYVDAWHVMNVAVATDYRRRGIATTLLERLFEVTATDPRSGYTLEVRVSNSGPFGSTSGSDSNREASAAGTTPTTARTP